MSTLCVVKYDGSKYPNAAHMRAGLNFEGTYFATGKEVTISADLAGAVLANYPAGFTLVSGETRAWSEKIDAIQAAGRMAVDRMVGVSPDAPLASLAGVPVLSVAARRIVADPKSGVEAIAAGKADKELPIVALVGHMMGSREIEMAAIGRAQALAHGE